MKILALTSSAHRDSFQPYLLKLTSTVIKYMKVIYYCAFSHLIKDKDTSVRDICVESLGMVSVSVSPPANKDGIWVYLNSLFQALGEQVNLINPFNN